MVTTVRWDASCRDCCTSGDARGQQQTSYPTHRWITSEALTELELKANSGVVQPTVCVLTGDVNLRKDVATALVQADVGKPYLLKHWHTETSNVAKSGDVTFVQGTASRA